MVNLVFFSASKDQKQYFSVLVQYLSIRATLIDYKKIWFPRFSSIPLASVLKLNQQAEFLVIRKKYTQKGMKKPKFYWHFQRFFNRVKAYWLFLSYCRWLKREPARFVAVWNGKKFRQAILVVAAEANNKHVIYFERGPLPGMTMVDPKGVNFFSSNPRDLAFYKSLAITLNEKKLENKTYRVRQVFVPFQVVEDSNVYMHSPWVRNMFAFFEEVKVLALLHPEIRFVFKTHPACKESYDELIQNNKAPNMIFQQDKSSRQLVDESDVVITLNSTVGMEALIAEKPLIVLGEAIYSVEGIVYLASSQQALKNQFDNVCCLTNEALLELRQNARKFVHYLRTEYAVQDDAMQMPSLNHFKEVEFKLLEIMNQVDESE